MYEIDPSLRNYFWPVSSSSLIWTNAISNVILTKAHHRNGKCMTFQGLLLQLTIFFFSFAKSSNFSHGDFFLWLEETSIFCDDLFLCLGTKSIFHVTYFADFWRICKILQKCLPVKTSPNNWVYINLSRYFQVTLASYWWSRTPSKSLTKIVH